MRKVAILCAIAFMGLAPGLAAGASTWDYVDDYAPIVGFNSLLVHVYPIGFRGEYSGACCYVNVKTAGSSYTFQYWFYYRYDIRITPEVDAALDALLGRVASLGILETEIDRLFHDHDWELVEVKVSRLGAVPDSVCYYAHGLAYCRSTSDWIWPAPLQGMHPLVKVVTDMHGTYPAGLWTPAAGGWANGGAILEFLLASTWERLAGYRPDWGLVPTYGAIDFTRRCRAFSTTMTSYHDHSGYPEPWPWDRGYSY